VTDEQHLVRAGTALSTSARDASRIDDLSAATGLDRLAFKSLHLAPGECVTICCGSDTEAFLYVHSGHGCLQADDTDVALDAGEFVAFKPAPTEQIVSIAASDTLVCLLGGEGALVKTQSPTKR
jgi:uncharacterized cupin superfamily protein